MFVTWPAPVDVPVNLTAEEEVDDEDIPDFRSLKLNVENPDLFVGHANGKSMSQRETVNYMMDLTEE